MLRLSVGALIKISESLIVSQLSRYSVRLGRRASRVTVLSG
jgi:hypothetical protein